MVEFLHGAMLLGLVVGGAGLGALGQVGAAPPVTSASTTGTASVKPIVFDVVSVKPNKTDESHPGSMIRKDGFDSENQRLIDTMFYAFNLTFDRNPDHFSGLPDWVKSERFDVVGKVADADVAEWKQLSDAEKGRVVQEVLFDRFRLKVHTETHEEPVYALVVAKGGPKMKEVPLVKLPAYGWSGYTAFNREGTIARQVSMKQFALYLSKQGLGRPVLDQTGLTGYYDFTLAFSPMQPSASADGEASAPAIDSARPFLFTALEDQLGLKLVPTKGPVERIVVDHIEQPEEN